MYSKEQTNHVLNRFWGGQLRFWEHEYGVSSDLNKTPAIEALTEMAALQLTYDPNVAFPKDENKLDKETVREFFKYRKMDIWGKDWEKHHLGGNWD